MIWTSREELGRKDCVSKVKTVNNSSVRAHNAQTRGTHYKAMVKPAYKVDGCTSWSTHSIVNF